MESYFVQFRNGIEMIWTRSAEINVALIRPIQKKKYILPYMLISRTNIHEFNLIQLWLDLDPVEIRELHKDSTNLSNEGTRLRVQSDRSWNFFSPVKHAAQSSFSSIFDNHDYVPRVYGGILAIVPGPSISHTSNEIGWPVEGKTILNRFGYLNGPANTGSKKRSSSRTKHLWAARTCYTPSIRVFTLRFTRDFIDKGGRIQRSIDSRNLLRRPPIPMWLILGRFKRRSNFQRFNIIFLTNGYLTFFRSRNVGRTKGRHETFYFLYFFREISVFNFEVKNERTFNA